MIAPVRRSARIAAKQRVNYGASNHHLALGATPIKKPRNVHKVRDRRPKGPKQNKNSPKVSKCHKRKRSESEPDGVADSAVKKRKLDNSQATDATEAEENIDPQEQKDGRESEQDRLSDKRESGKKRKRSIVEEENANQNEREQSPTFQPSPESAVARKTPEPVTSRASIALDQEQEDAAPQPAAMQDTTISSPSTEAQKTLEEIFSLVLLTRLARQKRSEEEECEPQINRANKFVSMLTRDYNELVSAADVAAEDSGLLQKTRALKERLDNIEDIASTWERKAANLSNQFHALRDQYLERRDEFDGVIGVGSLSKSDPAWHFAPGNEEFLSALEDVRKQTEAQNTMAATVASLKEERAGILKWIGGYCRQRLPKKLNEATQGDSITGYSDESMELALSRCGYLDSRLIRANDNLKSAGFAKKKSLDKLVVSAEKLFVDANLMEAAGRPENIDKSDYLPFGVYGSEYEDEANPNEIDSTQQPEAVAETTPQRSRGDIIQELNEARAEWREIREKFDAEEYRRLTAEDTADLKQPVCEDDEGAALVRKVTERTGSYKRAQERFLTILHEAQDAGIEPRDGPGDIQRDHPDDGWHNGEEEVLIAAAQPVVERWFLRNEAVPQPKRSCPSASSRPTLKSLSLGEDIFEKRYSIWAERIAELERTRNQLREDGPFEPAENDFHPRNLKANDEPPFDETGQMPRNIAELDAVSGNTKNDQMRGQELHERVNQTIDDDEEL